MCGRFELKTKYDSLPEILKEEFPPRLASQYETQNLIKPNNPVLVIKNEGKMKTTFIYWGFISPWAKDPFDKSTPKPFNARSETVEEKKLFKGSWSYKRCLLPATSFFEKGFRIRKKNHATFWLGGIWSRWLSNDGSEVESFCVLTTDSNELIKPIYHRMPCIIPNGLEKQWTENIKNADGLNRLLPIVKLWSAKDWLVEKSNNSSTSQMCLL